MNNNADNIYTSLANLYSAKIMYLDNNYDQSYIFLNHIISNSADLEIVDIAKYRKAKILIEEMEYDQANRLLGENPDNYQHIELKGDINYLQNNNEEAIRYYKKILTFQYHSKCKKKYYC